MARRNTFPASLARSFERSLIKLIEKVAAEVKPVLEREAKVVLDLSAVRQQSVRGHGIGEELRAIFDKLRALIMRLVPDTLSAKLASDVTAQTQERAIKDVNKQIARIIGQPEATLIFPTKALRAISEARVAESVRLIKDLPEEYLARLERLIYEGLDRGVPYSELAGDLEAELDIAKNRARKIAVDQINRTYSAVTRDRYNEIGVKHAIWVTALDDRVCPICLPLDGRRFTVERLQDEGWPPRHPLCLDPDTQIMTERGFVSVGDVKCGESALSLNPHTLEPEWCAVKHAWRQMHNGNMIHFESQSVDLLVTQNHSMFVGKRRQNGCKRRMQWEFHEAESLLDSGEFYILCDASWKSQDGDIVIGKTAFTPDGFGGSYSGKVSKVPYRGYVYGIELERNHVLLTRRNNRVAWTGNCRCTTIADPDELEKAFEEG